MPTIRPACPDGAQPYNRNISHECPHRVTRSCPLLTLSGIYLFVLCHTSRRFFFFASLIVAPFLKHPSTSFCFIFCPLRLFIPCAVHVKVRPHNDLRANKRHPAGIRGGCSRLEILRREKAVLQGEAKILTSLRLRRLFSVEAKRVFAV